MLRLWRDLYRVILHPQQVTLSRVRKAHSSKAEPIEVVLDVESHPMPAWEGAVDQLRGIVSGLRQDKADVEIVLSNHFARYAVIPWSNELTNPSETEAMVRIRFEEVYGNLADDWEISFSEAGYGEPGIACAIDRGLLHELKGLFNNRLLRLISVQPFLMAAFNQIHAKAGDGDFLMLLNEPGRLGLARISKRQWAGVRLVQSGNLPEELPGLLHREMLVSGMDLTGKYYLVNLDELRNSQGSASKPKLVEQQIVMGAVQ